MQDYAKKKAKAKAITGKKKQKQPGLEFRFPVGEKFS